MSSIDLWECGDCHAMLQAKRTLRRHWKDAQAAGKGHQGVLRHIFHPRSPPAPPVPSQASTATPSLPAVPYMFRYSPATFSLPSPAQPPQAPSSFRPNLSVTEPNGGIRTDVFSQLRSSRSTRNQDHQATGRNRPGVVDFDPTEGLPVQKWHPSVTKVNQDPSNEPNATDSHPSGATATSSAEWAAQFNTPQFPWPEKPLPSFFSQLPPWNQEMVRRARAGNTNPKLSVWENKTSSWMSAAEAEKRNNPLKSVHLNNLNQANGSKQEGVGGSPAHDEEEDHDDKSDDEADADNADDDLGPTAKKRKKYAPEERTFEVRQWKQVPSAVADRTEERKFLADRRPGMPSLYGGAYQNQVFGSMGLNTNGYGFSAANAGYDLGDGGGLGNAGTILGAPEEAAAPVRKNMPPKRKKKKGGPGRKKANPNPVPQTGAGTDLSAANGEQTLSGDGSKPAGDVSMLEIDNEGSESGSEGEGSEEGEIDEGGHEEEKQEAAAGKSTATMEKMEVEQSVPVPNNQQAPNDLEAIATNSANTEMTSHVAQAEDNNSELQTDTAPPDVIMQDEVMAATDHLATDAHSAEPAEPGITTSTIEAPKPSEQSVEALLAAAPIEVQRPDSISEIQPTVLPDPQPEAQALVQLQSEQPSQLVSEVLPEQSINLVPSAPTESTQDTGPGPVPGVPGLEPVPVQPNTQLPPITTAVAEAIDQPSISAPGNVDPTVPAPAAAPIAQQPNAVPEPTSPDLLGGLEDALNKNMDEQGGD